nr:hypothetical protein CFP56_64746 [Quercus suber]
MPPTPVLDSQRPQRRTRRLEPLEPEAWRIALLTRTSRPGERFEQHHAGEALLTVLRSARRTPSVYFANGNHGFQSPGTERTISSSLPRPQATENVHGVVASLQDSCTCRFLQRRGPRAEAEPRTCSCHLSATTRENVNPEVGQQIGTRLPGRLGAGFFDEYQPQRLLTNSSVMHFARDLPRSRSVTPPPAYSGADDEANDADEMFLISRRELQVLGVSGPGIEYLLATRRVADHRH